MIERLDTTDSGMDWAAYLGRGALLAGSAYGVSKTFQEYKNTSLLKKTSFNEMMGKHLGSTGSITRPGQSFNANLFSANPLEIKSPERLRHKRYKGDIKAFQSLIDKKLKGGWKGHSKKFAEEFGKLYNALQSQADISDLNILVKGKNLESIIIHAKRGKESISFPFSTVNSFGEISKGWNLQTTYSAVNAIEDADNLLTSDIVGLDVFTAQEYQRRLPDILSGKISAKDINKKVYKSAIYDEGAYGKTTKMATGQIGTAKAEQRKSKVVLYPMGNASAQANVQGVKALHSKKGMGIGTAADMARGQVYLPGSPISFLPAAEVSPNIPQLLRNTVVRGEAVERNINWMPDKLKSFDKFNMKVIPEEDRWLINAIRSKLSEGRGFAQEIAEESIIWNKNRPAKITTSLYSYKTDITKPQTKFTEQILEDIATSQGMTKSSLIDHLRTQGPISLSEGKEYDLLKRRRELEAQIERQKLFIKDVKDVEQKTQMEQELANLQQARKEYGTLGFKSGTDKLVKLKDQDIAENVLTQISLNENELVFKTRSGSMVGEGSKFFAGSGLKVVSSGNEDIEKILGQYELNKTAGVTDPSKLIWATEDGLKAAGLHDAFKNIDFLSFRQPFKFNEAGALEARDIPAAIMSYAERLAEDKENLNTLKELGFNYNESNKMYSRAESAQNQTDIDILKKIRARYAGKTDREIFSFKDSVIPVNLAADVSTSQSGFGGLATMSERARYNVEVMGLSNFSESLDQRMIAREGAIKRFRTLANAQELIVSNQYSGAPIGKLHDEAALDAAFTGDINTRRKYLQQTFGEHFKNDTVIVNLGKKVGGIEKVAIYADPALAPHIGTMAGRGESPTDLSTKNLIQSINNNQSEAYQLAHAMKYKEQAGALQETINKDLFRSKVLGSTYGQAMPSLSGMDDTASALAKALGHEGSTAPVVAVSKKDFFKAHYQMGKSKEEIRSLYQEAMQGNYWGMLTREPSESVQRNIPVNIHIAEKFKKDARKGVIYIAGEDRSTSMLRQALGVDWDKDPLHLVYSGGSKASQELASFMNANTQNVMAQEYQRSLKRMALFSLKGKQQADRGSMSMSQILEIKDAQAELEKTAIGPYSNQFKNIHVGLRDQVMGGNVTKAMASKFYAGEELSLTLVENILKAKNLGEESLRLGEAFKPLEILRNRTLSQEEKAIQMKESWDKMFFRDNYTKLAELTQTTSLDNIPEELQKVFGSGIQAKDKIKAYQEVFSLENFTNIIQAHDLGQQIQESGSVAENIGKTFMKSTDAGFLSKMSRMYESVAPALKSGAKNIAKYGLLPMASIGLVASMTSSPKILAPTQTTGSQHESQQAETQVKMPQTVYALPPSKTDGMKIRGTSNHRTNMNTAIQGLRSQNNDVNIRFTDHRAPSDKYRMQEMIDRGR